MLRASLSKRESSICAFCQHRLSLRTATPRNRRQLSGTRSLKDNDGWGNWGGGWGSQPKAPAQSQQDDILDPAELIARKKLLEKQQQQEAQQAQARARAQQLQQTPEPPKTRVSPASLGPRFMWNADKQQAVEQSLRRDSLSLRNNNIITRDIKRLDISSFGRKLEEKNNVTREPSTVRNVADTSSSSTKVNGEPVAKRLIRYDFGLSRGGHVGTKPEIQKKLGDNSIIPSKPSQPLQSQPLRPLPRQPSQSSQPPQTSQPSLPSQPPQTLQPPQPPQSTGESDWGTFARKLTPLDPPEPLLPPQSLQSQPLKPQPLQPEPLQVEPLQAEPLQAEPLQEEPLQEEPLQAEPLQAEPPQPSQASQSPQSSQPPQISQPPQSLKSTGDSDWGMLARKLTPPEPDSENFWAALTQNGKDKEEKKSQASNAAAQASGKSKPQDPWADMASQLNKASEHKDMYDWGVELGKENAREAKRLQSSKEKPQESAPILSQADLSMEQGSKGRDRVRDRDRERRLSRFEREEDDSRGREKRSRRRGQKYNDDDEGGFDYEDYAERRRTKARLKAQREAERAGPRPILIPELINIKALAEALKVEPKLFLTQLGELGFEGVSLDSLMAGETAALVAQEYGFEPTVEAGEELDLKPRPPPEDPTALPLRPPVVTIMGHVDHGKTTLLDYLRKSSIAAQEHGGITQRIGAFSVKLSSGKPITFLDTPGHAAFLTMRQRGAYVTDIVVLVVAADDSVKPQTIEAIKHARAAKVPMIVAINKIDKEGARIDQVKNDLAQEGVEIEDFGGDVQVVCVSGKTGQGMEDLEENILTLSEILDHRAELDGPAEGWILESNLKPMGKAATVLVKRGTMRIGDYIAAGLTWGKIRHIRNEAGVEIGEALPGTPVEILGWKELPAAGDQVIQGSDEARVKAAVEYREGLRELEKDAAAHEEISESRRLLQEKRAREKELAEAGDSYEALPEEENGTKMVNFSVKGDLHGSVEAVEASILELGSHEVRPRILRSGTGPIHEFDVEHAAMSKSVIVNFATTTPGYIKQMAEEQGVKILDHTVIYHLVDEVKAILSTYLAPEVTNKVLGEAEVLQIFPINIKGRKYKNIAGCKVRNGTLEKGRLFRVTRRGEPIFDGNLETLKHLKKDVTEVKKGTECGLGFEEFQDFEIGDQIQAYEKVETERSF